MDDHSIYRLEIELATGAKGFAEALQDRTSRLAREVLLDRIDGVLSEHSEDGPVFELDRLELDLGTIAASRFESEFVERTERELRKALNRRLPRRGSKPAEGEFTTTDRAVALFLGFLEHGTLPWWSTSVRARLGLEGILDRAIRRGGHSFGRELARLLDRESVRLRLVQHLTDESLLRLVDVLMPALQPHLGRFVTAVQTRWVSVGAGPFVSRDERNQVWKAVMHAVAENALASGPVTLMAVVNDVWKRVSDGVAWMGDRKAEHFQNLLDVASIDVTLRNTESEIGDLQDFDSDLEAWRKFAKDLFESDPDRLESWISAFSHAGERGREFLIGIPDEVWDRFENRRYPDLGGYLESFRSGFRWVARDELGESLLEGVLRAAIRSSLAEELAGTAGRPARMPDAVTWVRRALEAWSLARGESRDSIVARFHRLVVDRAAETHLDSEFLEAVDTFMTDEGFVARKSSTSSFTYSAVDVATTTLLTEFCSRLARELRALLVMDGKHPGGGLAQSDDVDRAVAGAIRVAPASRSQDALLLRVMHLLATNWGLEWEAFAGTVLQRVTERMAGSGREPLWDRLVRETRIRDELERLGAGRKVERGISAGSGTPKVLAGSVDWLRALTIYMERHALPLDVGLSDLWQGLERVCQAEPRRVGIWLDACLAVPARRRLLMLGCPDAVLVHLLDAAQPGAGTAAWMLFRRVGEALSSTATSHRTGLSFGHAVLEVFHQSVQSGFRTRSFLEQVLRVLRTSVVSSLGPSPSLSATAVGPIPRNRMIDLLLAAEAWTTTSKSTEIEVASVREPKLTRDWVSKPRHGLARQSASSQTGRVIRAGAEGQEPEVSSAVPTERADELQREDMSQVRGGHEPGTTPLSAEGEMPKDVGGHDPGVGSPGGTEAKGESLSVQEAPNFAEWLLDGVDFLAAVAVEFRVGEGGRTKSKAEASSAELQEGASATQDAGGDETRQAQPSQSEQFLQMPEAQLIRGHPWPPAVRDAMWHWMAAVSAGGPSARSELERLLRQWAWSLRIPAPEFAQKLWPVLVEIAPVFRTHLSRAVFGTVLERLLPPWLVSLPSSSVTGREGGVSGKDNAATKEAEDARQAGPDALGESKSSKREEGTLARFADRFRLGSSDAVERARGTRVREIRNRGPASGQIWRVNNAGMILLWPYLGTLFERAGLMESDRFRSDGDRNRAVVLLQCLVSGSITAPEYELVLNKWLCGCPFDAPFDVKALGADDWPEMCEGLLRAVIGHWSILRDTSPAGLRETFLMRWGDLSRIETRWMLRVDPGPFDILVQHISWGIGVVVLPWLPEPLHVEWK